MAFYSRLASGRHEAMSATLLRRLPDSWLLAYDTTVKDALEPPRARMKTKPDNSPKRDFSPRRARAFCWLAMAIAFAGISLLRNDDSQSAQQPDAVSSNAAVLDSAIAESSTQP